MNIPDKVFIYFDKNGLKAWKPITEQPRESDKLFYSEAEYDAGIKQAKQEQMDIDANIAYEYLAVYEVNVVKPSRIGIMEAILNAGKEK